MVDPAPFLECLPCSAPITQEFGAMDSGYAHRGRDYGCVIGTPILAGASGKVVPCTNDGSFGNAVCIDYENGLFGLYAHLSRINVNMGDRVSARMIIGLSGNTGVSTGPHCHQQLCVNTQFPTDISYSRDPRKFLITEDSPMTPAEAERMARLERIVIANGFDAYCRPGTEACFPPGTQVWPEGVDPPASAVVRLTGENALRYADLRQFSLGLAIELKK
jgi:murein DD-endopeptidase MepM/ murein hydrolase activator NlpD